MSTGLTSQVQATCLPDPGLAVGSVPDRLAARTTDGTLVGLQRSQLGRAATIVSVGSRTPGVGRDGILVALIAALAESSLRMLSNTAAYPGSAAMPSDGDGSDHDSLGLFQMRPAAGWGTVEELMDPGYQARAFFGGPTGPNHGSPAGLLDVRGWRDLSPAGAAQAVEVSAYPDRYTRFVPVAEAILRAIGTDTTDGASSDRTVFPLPAGTSHRTDTFGPRSDPITGASSMHTGVDYAAPAGTPIRAIADGRVVFAGAVSSGYAHLILIRHTIAGRSVVSAYAHMYAAGLQVRTGQHVTAGQQIAEVGADGKATGPHLHFEIRHGGANAVATDPGPWLAAHGATGPPPTTGETTGPCGPSAGRSSYSGANPDRLVDDPTTDGRITARTAYVLAQVRRRFPTTSWACWRPGDTRSEHPSGRACDGTLGNAIGQRASGPSLALGWRVTNWLKANARTLGVEYLIWQGRIWSVARASEGWRAYDGGGMHDPGSVTGGHYDHVHFTAMSPRSGQG